MQSECSSITTCSGSAKIFRLPFRTLPCEGRMQRWGLFYVCGTKGAVEEHVVLVAPKYPILIALIVSVSVALRNCGDQ